MYILPITSILGRLPVVRAGDTGTIPFGYSSGCCNGCHRYNHDLASADFSRWAGLAAGDGCPMYFVNSQAPGWSSKPWSAIKWSCDIGYCPLLHIIIYFYINHYYIMFSIFTSLLSCYYILLHELLSALLQNHHTYYYHITTIVHH